MNYKVLLRRSMSDSSTFVSFLSSCMAFFTASGIARIPAYDLGFAGVPTDGSAVMILHCSRGSSFSLPVSYQSSFQVFSPFWMHFCQEYYDGVC